MSDDIVVDIRPEMINPNQKNMTKIMAENWEEIKTKYDLAPEIRDRVVGKYWLFEKNYLVHGPKVPAWALLPNRMMEKNNADR